MDSEISGRVKKFLEHAHNLYGPGFIPLHRPLFVGDEKQRLLDCIDSNFVSSAGALITAFEEQVATYTGIEHAVATVNGTAAIQVALRLVGVEPGDEVVTQALTFVATSNAIAYTGATPTFIDVDRETMGMSQASLANFLEEQTQRSPNGELVNRLSGRRIAAVMPMHTFGHPCHIAEIAEICGDYELPLVEDAAEALGTRLDGQHVGTHGQVATLSFNGNKVITTGGGGMLLTNDPGMAARAKHLTTTAKQPNAWNYFHDEVGYNYRMPNLNAALGVAQMEKLDEMLAAKRVVADRYAAFFEERDEHFVIERAGVTANYWLNAILTEDRSARDEWLARTNEAGVMTRPAWDLMADLPMYRECQNDGLENARWLQERLVNIPSSVPDGWIDNQ